ncbi:phage terminase large subunit [Roseovarius sp. A-2]|nr:phage terminase large subunit [Roseovarius sp. A-2]
MTAPATLDRARRRLSVLRRDVLAPRERLTLSQWADRYAVLSPETSAEPGRWKTLPFQKEIMDAMSDPTLPLVVFRKSARLGYTKMLDWLVGYHIHWDPAPILFFQPTEKDAKDFEGSEIMPMIRDIEGIRELSNINPNGKSKEEWHTKKFRNGASLRLRGAHAEDNFRRLTTRINLGDEIDAEAWNPKPGGSDKLRLLARRGTTFWNAKQILGSTPTAPASEGGRIDGLFQQSDQRYYHVPCPHCGQEQKLIWGGTPSGDGPGLKYEKDGEEIRAWYEGECGCVIEERDKLWMIERGRWVAENPGASIRGYHLWQIYSTFPAASWRHIAAQWLDAKEAASAQIRNFKNEVLGEPYSTAAATETADEETLYQAVTDLGDAEVPAWARATVWGIDRQKGSADGSESYLEASLWAFGPGRRPFLVSHWVLDEYPQSDPRCWDALEKLATRTFTDTNGRPRKADGLAIDHNGGDAQRVVSWLARMRKIPGRKYWVAVRGQSKGNGARGKTIWPQAAAKRSDFLYTVDVDLAKDEIADVLASGAIEFGVGGIDGSVCLSDPAELERFVSRMLSEKRYPVPGGGTKWVGPKGKGRDGNEPFDCLVYAWALTYGMEHLPGGLRWRRTFAPDPIVRVDTVDDERESLSERAAADAPRRDPEPEPTAEQTRPARPGLKRIRRRF